ncbi:MAG: hypothetical protein LKE54_11410 [Prevotella sp.]|jgi:hypothetical protein|nr:hypothetical protein [Prevotella sp.]MCH3995624.1 hypothetical protein [Prevotella sp.]
MKRIIIALVALFTFTGTISAMSYEQARDQALFLTDKMAYELNLTDEQYQAAYEVNLDYLMSIDNYDDLYGTYWRERNQDLSYILLDWQYNSYLNSLYFYRPLYWNGGYWHFRVYARYPRRDFYYFGSPTFIVNYRGGHSWRNNGGRSWYRNRPYINRNYGRQSGMRDAFNRGDYGSGRVFGNMGSRNASYQNNGTFGSMDEAQNTRTHINSNVFGRQSSTRTTVKRNSNSVFGSGRSFTNSNSTPKRTFTPRSNSGNSSTFGASRSRTSAPSNRSFGSGSFGSHSSSKSSGGGFGGGHSKGSFGGGSFGGHR